MIPSQNPEILPLQEEKKKVRQSCNLRLWLRELNHHSQKESRKRTKDKNFQKFLQLFKQLHINIPLIETLRGMPNIREKWWL